MNRSRRVALAVTATVTALGLALAGCAGGASGAGSAAAPPVSPQEVERALTTPTELTFWTWVPDIEKRVQQFEQQHPAIKVKVENVGQGLAHYQRVRTALQSGNGAPDLIQIEYQYIPSFTLTKSLLDLSPHGARDLQKDYVGWVWNQVATTNGVWAVPQDTGPMGNLYREDVMAKAGVTAPPATYADYAAAAQKVRATGAYISNFPVNDPAQVIGLFWQAGAKPFGYDGDKTVTINVNSPQAKQVMAYWQDLIARDLVSVDADFTDSFYQGLANGKYAGWLTAAWAPVFLQGTVETTSGKWRAAPLPQWAPGQNTSGNWGGSSDAVLATTKNPVAAYELAKFINNDPASTKALVTEQSLYPATSSLLKDPAFVDSALPFFGGQPVNGMFAKIADTVDTDFQWLPFTDFAYSAFNEIVGSAIGQKGDLGAALDRWQDALMSYAKAQGFTVR